MLTKLIRSNFRQDFSHMLSFFLIMVLAAFMLHTGLMILFGYRRLFEQKRTELQSAEVIIEQQTDDPEAYARIEELLRSSEDVEAYEGYQPLFKPCQYEDLSYGDDSKNSYAIANKDLLFLPYGEWGEIEAPSMVELTEEEYGNEIYLSYKENSDLLHAWVGEEVDLQVDELYYRFRLGGLFESISAGGVLPLAYVSPQQFTEWQQRDDGVYHYNVFLLRIAPDRSPLRVAGELSERLSQRGITASVHNIDATITESTFMQNIVAAIVSAFAILITAVAMVVIYFRISNTIEQTMASIGALKAIGYTALQIRLGIVLEFLLTSAVAFLLGVTLSFAALPGLEEMLGSFSNLRWHPGFDPLSFFLTAAVILGTVLLVCLWVTRSIARLEPVKALQAGSNPSPSTVNHLPVETARGPLTWILGWKSMRNNPRQGVMLSVIMTIIGVVSTFAVYLGYNMVAEPINLYHMLNNVSPDVSLIVKDDRAFHEIEELPGVEAVWWMDTTNMSVEGQTTYVTVTEDWTAIPRVNVYAGRVPRAADEVSVGGALARSLGLGLGDQVTVRNGSRSRSFTITGFQQSADNNGNELGMTAEGASLLGHRMSKSHLDVMVSGHSLSHARRVVEEAEAMLDEKLESYTNMVEAVSEGANDLIAVAALLAALLVLISVAVIVLSMNLLVKTVIIRRNREFGIQKAVGFTSRQLRQELALSMLPPILLGNLLGSVFGYFGSNRLMALLFRSLGIMRASMEVFPWMSALAAGAMTLISYLIIWRLSRRIRRISAYSLITE